MRSVIGACPRRVISALALIVVALTLAPATGAVAAQDDRQVIRVGTEGTYPPFSFSADGQLTGYDIEVIEAVAERAGWELEFVQSQFDALFGALDAGRIDLIANQITINPEREESYVFSEPYTYSRGVIVAAKDNDEISSLEDLEGKVTAQSATSNWSQVAEEAGARVENVEQFAQAADLVSRGRVDAIVNDNIAVLDYLASTGDDQVEVVGEAGEEVSRQALAFRPEDEQLAAEADRALDSLRADGTLREISEEYFRADVSVEGGGEADVGEGRGGASAWQVAKDTAWPALVALIKVTLTLTVLSFSIGLAAAVPIALARMSTSRWLSWPARSFISAVRGTPLLLQLFVVFFGLPQVGIDLPPYVAGALALSVNVAGYAAESVRGALLSVPHGQHEAAATLGMSRALALRRVVLPQAARIAVPPLSNTLVSLVKDTSLVSVVLLTDLFRVVQVEASASFQYLPLYALAGLYYWIVCTVLSTGQQRLETRLNRYVTT
ncbi:ABC transporter substrate-binding protein/permease [Aeromicrobium sp. CTD01-1L150]|uniref:ABC transporter substrate-binding protein/permease n=1 Tax=Aeromicrobium sp. CTD01-1L150 TaxID=3341830 RepID=UPI0035BFC44B